MATDLVNAFLGPYKLTQRVTEGGTGLIYMAETPQSTHCRKYVAKVLAPEHAKDKEVLDAFAREHDILKTLDDPNFPKVLRFDTVRKLPGYVMEFIEGANVGQLVKEGRVFSRQAAFMQMVRLVAILHQREYTHNDIKPENFLVRQGDGKMLLIDFGNARKQVKEGITTAIFRRRRLKRIRGTPAYMAPEALAGKRPNYKTDVYALGACAHFLFTNKLIMRRDIAGAGRGKTAMAQEIKINVPGLGPKINGILSRCIRTEPEARPENAIELLQMLKKVVTKEMITKVDRMSRGLAEKAKADVAEDERKLSKVEEAAKRAADGGKFIG